MTDLSFRIDMLEQSGQITAAEAGGLFKMVELFSGRWGIVLNEDNAGMFIVHFAIALKRSREGDIVAELAQSLLDEVEQSPGYERSLAALEEIEDEIGIKLPDAEKGYILLHLNKYFAC